MAGLAETVINSVKLELKVRLSFAINNRKIHTLINLSFLCLYGGMVQKRCNGSSFSKNCSIHAADLNTCMKGKGGD